MRNSSPPGEPKRCFICGEDNPNVFNEHHIIRQSQGGSDQSKNLVTLCSSCHEAVEKIYDNEFWERVEVAEDGEDSGNVVERIYTAGAMSSDRRGDHPVWRSTLRDGLSKSDLAGDLEVVSPAEVAIDHGSGPVDAIAGGDMELLESCDAVVAYFEKPEQYGTLSEVMYAVGKEMPVLAIFHPATADGEVIYTGSTVTEPSKDGGFPFTDGRWRWVSEPSTFAGHEYWFPHNALTGDSKAGPRAEANGWTQPDHVRVAHTNSEEMIPEIVNEWCHQERFHFPVGKTRVGECDYCGRKHPSDNLISGTHHQVCLPCSKKTEVCQVCGDVAAELVHNEEGPGMPSPQCRDCWETNTNRKKALRAAHGREMDSEEEVLTKDEDGNLVPLSDVTPNQSPDERN